MKHLLVACLMVPIAAVADPAVVEDVSAQPSAGTWSFHVTLRHADTGWDDYADGWRVELSDGTILGERTLYHPHVQEQPFTRSLSGVKIPDGVSQVQIRARTLTDGWDSATYSVQLKQ